MSYLQYDIEIQNRARVRGLSLSKLSGVVEKLLQKMRKRHVGVSVVLVNDRQIQRLNREYLNHDWATDVITFSQLEGKSPKAIHGKTVFWGDIVVSITTAKREAKKHSHSLFYEVSFYLCHGLLHMMGWQDNTNQKRTRMLQKQEALLKGIGL